MKIAVSILAFVLGFSAFGQGQFQKESYKSLKATSDKIMQLADAIPSDSYEWYPEEGVRSITEVFGHVISANYFFASKMGAQMPEDVDLQALRSGTLEDKETIQEMLQQSYTHVLAAIKNIKDDDLANKVEFPFPGEYTVMTAVFITLAHNDEHLGQLIAYSRVNGVTPPWSETAEK